MTSSIKSAEIILDCLSALNPCGYFVAPGSRNAPFLQTLGLMGSSSIPTFIHFDERALAFWALGAAKASQKPAIIITTSGTALGNLYPAIMEAFVSKIPLVVISADRPYELLEQGANQTCLQDRIYGDYAEFLHIPCLNDAINSQVVSSKILSAIRKIHNTWKPLHINVELREPLYGVVTPIEERKKQNRLLIDNFKASLCVNSTNSNISQLADCIKKSNAVILVGCLLPEQADIVYQLATTYKLPILADIQSNLRGKPGVIGCYEKELNSDTHLTRLLTNASNIVIFEGRFLSSSLLGIIRQSSAKRWFCSRYPENLDATNSGGIYLTINYESLIQELHLHPLSKLELDAYAHDMKEYQPASPLTPNDSELEYTASLNHATENTIFIGNSLVARYADIVINSPKYIYTNRGISGIDGLIATAAGIASIKGPTLAIIGDTSALYDISSLTLLKKTPVRLIIFNNNGGRIFEKFPINHRDTKKQLFINPNKTNFVALARAFDLNAIEINNAKELTDYLKKEPSSKEGTVIECCFEESQGFQALEQFLNS